MKSRTARRGSPKDGGNYISKSVLVCTRQSDGVERTEFCEGFLLFLSTPRGGGVEEKLLRWKMVSPSTARRVSSRNSSLKCADFNFLEQSTSKKEKVPNFPADLIKSHHET